MEAKSNIIYFESAKKKRKIQKMKSVVLRPTVIAFLFVFTVYGIIASGYFINGTMQSKPNMSKSYVELDSFHPASLPKVKD